MTTEQSDQKVYSTKRKHRPKCHELTKLDPDHLCSPDHVRVPAHCRLKRNRKKKATNAIISQVDSHHQKRSRGRPRKIRTEELYAQ